MLIRPAKQSSPEWGDGIGLGGPSTCSRGGRPPHVQDMSWRRQRPSGGDAERAQDLLCPQATQEFQTGDFYGISKLWWPKPSASSAIPHCMILARLGDCCRDHRSPGQGRGPEVDDRAPLTPSSGCTSKPMLGCAAVGWASFPGDP